MESLIQRMGWLVILACALGVSGWSIYWIAQHEGAPAIVALAAPACFDGVALLCGYYSLKAVRKGRSGLVAKCWVFGFAGASAYVNSWHAVLSGHGSLFVRCLWAIPSLAAVVVYEVHTRQEKEAALARLSKTVPPLPALGFLSWVLFPIKSYRAIRRLVAYQRAQMLARFAPGAFLASQGQDDDSSDTGPDSFPGIRESVEGQIETSQIVSYTSPAEIRAWARGKGLPVNERGSIPQDIIAQYYRENKGGNNEQTG